MQRALLDNTVTRLERSLAEAGLPGDQVEAAIDVIATAKLVNPPPSLLPWLVYEYGLSELVPFVPNLYALIGQGVDWQNRRGTMAAIDLGLSWIGYAAELEEADWRRRHWNLFQLQLDRVRQARADLDRIEGISRLSSPARSLFWRGFKDYDVRPLSYSGAHFSGAHFSEYSGARTRPGGPLWSFGRRHVFDHALTSSELMALGVFLPEVGESETVGWGPFAWSDTDATWQSLAARVRGIAMAAGVPARPAWIVFSDDDGVIGYRRAIRHFVLADPGGPYQVSGLEWSVSQEATQTVYISARTGFGDGEGRVATSVGVVFDAVPLDRPGRLWALPDQLGPGSGPVSVRAVSIPLSESIREQVTFLLRF